MVRQLFIYIVLLFSLNNIAQKYNFVNWTVEDGLIQSQSGFICQDKYRQLWIATEGGISKFDGRKFTGYAAQEGLVSNDVNSLLCDRSGNIWAGTNYGISVFNGKTFKTIKPTNTSVNNITALLEMPDESIYALNNNLLFKINNFECKQVPISDGAAETVSAIYKTEKNQLLAFVMEKGLFILEQNKWNNILTVDESAKNKLVRKLFITSKGDTLLGSNSGLLIAKNNKIESYTNSKPDLNGINILCIAEDVKKNIWLGSDNGAYKIEGQNTIHFDSKSGFTDNSVLHIYKDIENNLWFATDADGIYKFTENTFTYYDKSSGISNTIVMGVVQTTDGTIFAAGYGGGLYKINSKNNIEPVNNKGPVLTDSKISCLYADDENNIWIGTIGKGSWRYNEKNGLQKIIDNNTGTQVRGANSFLKDAQGNMLLGTGQGIYVIDKQNNVTKLKTDNISISALKQFTKDSVLVGTSKGIFVLDKEYKQHSLNKKEFENSSVLCLAKKNDNLWIGTTDKGVINWNLKTGKIINYNTDNGLPSNFIYSIYVYDKQKAWIGTGFGISNLQLDKDDNVSAIKNYGRSDGLLGMECSHNCLLKAADSSLWFGTTKGLFHFNPDADLTEKNQPVVLLKSVKLFSSDITDSSLYQSMSTWFNVPNNLKLHSNQNHLTFEFGAIYFTNPEDILFRCKLEGIDKDFTISNNPYIIYSAIPPGKYTLKVQAITKSGVSSNTIEYPFEIEKAFYQTGYFQLLVVLLLISTGALITYISTRQKQKRKETLEKIREEEFMKLRHRTAEDFHDEMGNRLTRISVLTDILKSKLVSQESEATKLVGQIKENTAALYNGSRDIIWSLNSQNDGIFQIAEHIKEIGDELFHDTVIDFECTHNIKAGNALKLKLDYSRNLIMVFKEVYSNILKHSKATKVEIFLEIQNNNKDIEIKIRDNGEGFDSQVVQKGNGIKNMKNRASRMNGELSLNSTLNKGTEINISLKNIFI
jgi:ligand-binding sensor domain-containing protein/signal transduction histidine kinase